MGHHHSFRHVNNVIHHYSIIWTRLVSITPRSIVHHRSNFHLWHFTRHLQNRSILLPSLPSCRLFSIILFFQLCFIIFFPFLFIFPFCVSYFFHRTQSFIHIHHFYPWLSPIFFRQSSFLWLKKSKTLLLCPAPPSLMSKILSKTTFTFYCFEHFVGYKFYSHTHAETIRTWLTNLIIHLSL